METGLELLDISLVTMMICNPLSLTPQPQVAFCGGVQGKSKPYSCCFLAVR